MALMGKAALAMWWDVAADIRSEFEDWHSHEHYRERLGIPGFLRANRWSLADGGEGVFQMYELESHEVLSSGAYLDRLNSPTPWSTKMMPHHRNMVRSQCRVLESGGASVSRNALTVRFSPLPGHEDALRQSLRDLIVQLVDRPGCVGGHVLRHESPAIAMTKEQIIRGGDKTADWIFLAMGYDERALRQLMQTELSEEAMIQRGAQSGTASGLYILSYSTTATDIA
jgi:hypothetical protein